MDSYAVWRQVSLYAAPLPLRAPAPKQPGGRPRRWPCSDGVPPLGATGSGPQWARGARSPALPSEKAEAEQRLREAEQRLRLAVEELYRQAPQEERQVRCGSLPLLGAVVLCAVLGWAGLCCTALHCTALPLHHCTALHCTALHWVSLVELTALPWVVVGGASRCSAVFEVRHPLYCSALYFMVEGALSCPGWCLQVQRGV